MSVRPAVIGRLAGHGRPIAAGEPANLTLIDPSASWLVEPAELASLSRNTPFAGRRLPGRVLATFLRGRATVRDGRLLAPAGGRVTRIASPWNTAMDQHRRDSRERGRR